MNEFQQAVGDHLTSKELPESHVTWVTSVPILVFQGLCVLELDTVYASDRQTSCKLRLKTMLGCRVERSVRCVVR